MKGLTVLLLHCISDTNATVAVDLAFTTGFWHIPGERSLVLFLCF